MVQFEKAIDGDTWLSQVPDSYYLFFNDQSINDINSEHV